LTTVLAYSFSSSFGILASSTCDLGEEDVEEDKDRDDGNSAAEGFPHGACVNRGST